MKAIVSLSGGLDSTVLLSLVRKQTKNIVAVYVAYGSNHSKMEHEAAAHIADYHDVDFRTIDLPLAEVMKSSLLGDEGSLSGPDTVVPFRNLMIAAVLFQVANQENADTVYFGVNRTDSAIYMDCRGSYMEQTQKLLNESVEDISGIRIVTPFLHAGKFEIVRMGDAIGAPLGTSYSCYKGGKTHCGLCGACEVRRKAFKDAKVKDPTRYEFASPGVPRCPGVPPKRKPR